MIYDSADPGRSRHYGHFYGLAPLPAGETPRLMVLGNCQAESLRILLDSTGTFRSFRIPPIHEWERADLERVQDLLPQTDVLVMQPVRDNYRGMPCGTSQLQAFLPADARLILVPVLRYDGLMPYQAIVRIPTDTSLNPPIVPYHDLRILAAAFHGESQPRHVEPSAAQLRELAAMSVAHLRRREQAHGTVVMSDVLALAPVWHTINHPDNSTLVALAEKIAGPVTAPERDLLGGVQTPIDPAAARALGVEVEGRDSWAPSLEHTQAHFEFYARHPEGVDAGIERHADRLHILGLI